MAKETVRYPDALVARIETFVTDSSAFESKSEYHRFASDFLLSLLDPDHDPSVLGYGEIFSDLETDLGGARTDADDEPFLETYIRVRRHLLRGDPDAARAVVDDAYDVTDREALLLDEVISRARRGESAGDGPRSHAVPARQRPGANGLSHADGGDAPTETDAEAETTGGDRTDDAETPSESSVDADAGGGAEETPVESEF
jgi:hypothetical protein